MIKFSRFTIFGGAIVVIITAILIFNIDWVDLKMKQEIKSLQLYKQKILSPPTREVSESTKIYTNNDCINLFPDELCGMYLPTERVKLYDICSKAEVPKTELDTTVYPENKIAVIRWRDSNIQQNITLYLPYEPEAGFIGCSESAKLILKNIQEVQTQIP